MALAIATRQRILNWYRGTVFTTVPANFYVALLTTNPSDETGTGLVEVVNAAGASQWNGYARQPIVSSTAGWSATPGGTTNPQTIANAALIDYGNASISSGTITVTGFALYDAVTAGVFHGWVALTGGSKIVNNGDDVTFAIGALVLSQ